MNITYRTQSGSQQVKTNKELEVEVLNCQLRYGMENIKGHAGKSSLSLAAL